MQEKTYPTNTVLVTGFAQLPKGTTLYERYKIIGVVLVIDLDTSEIVDAELTFIADLPNRFLVSMIKGYFLNQGIDLLLEKVKSRFRTPSQGAIIQAIRSAYDRYIESFKN